MGNLIKRGLIVSCQPYYGDETFYDYEFIKRFAMSAEFGGAVGLRIEGPKNIIRLIKDGIDIPIIGLIKKVNTRNSYNRISITPSVVEVAELYGSGVSIIATDFTARERRDRSFYKLFMKEIKQSFKNIDIFADVSTIDEAIIAQDFGASYISSTLTGYTERTKNLTIPNFDILAMFKEQLSIPYIAEGGFSSIEDVQKALSYGVHGVVIGTAITRPHILIERYSKLFKELYREDYRTS